MTDASQSSGTDPVMAESGALPSFTESSQLKTATERAIRAENQLATIRNSLLWRASLPARAAARRFKARKASGSLIRGRGAAIDSGARDKATAGRLRTVLQEFGQPSTDDDLDQLFAAVQKMLAQNELRTDLLWLLFVAALASFPTEDQMEALHADMVLGGPEAVVQTLRTLAPRAPDSWASLAPLDLVRVPVVDPTMTATRDVHTGIQRVVRELTSRWLKNSNVAIAVFEKELGVWRYADKAELARLTQWTGAAKRGNEVIQNATARSILVPWHTTFILPEAGSGFARSDRTRALVRYSGTQTSCILFDLVPYVLSETCNNGIIVRFSKQMSIVRQSKRVSTISKAVGKDLEGLNVAFRHQGIPGPQIKAHPLPVEAVNVAADVIQSVAGELGLKPGRPLLLSVGSIEPRKNHVRTLQAAELLWREGYDFELIFIAGNGWDRELFDREFARLVAKGRPVRVLREAREELLWAAYRLARFTIFIAIAEGYGLPAAESIAAGTPVLLTGHGSMEEIGREGGAEFIDPYSVVSVTDGMRRLLTDDDRLAELKGQIAQRSLTTWDQYAIDTWEWLVGEVGDS